MKKLVFAIMIIIFISVLPACEAKEEEQEGSYSDNLRLERDYEGYSFMEDGIGEVELVECRSGHFTDFREVGSDEVFHTRYLGIATPAPYTNPPQPWSIAARDHVCEVLGNAEKIILEADPESARRDGTSWPRWLTYVWYDDGEGELRNLNLEMIELAFSAYTGGSSLYGDTFRSAWFEAEATGRRTFGEEDLDPRTGD